MRTDGSTKRRRKSKPLAERFWPKVDVGDPWNCWLWTAAFNNQGYGFLGHDHTEADSTLAHRIAWELTVGPILAGEVLRHLCHDPLCCNPCHLMPGSQSDNLLDRRSNPSPKPIPARPPKRPLVPMVLRGCLTCGFTFAVPLSRVEQSGGLFCCRAHVRHSPEERFWKRVKKTDTCWLWTGAKNKGYGVLGKGPKGGGYVQAHRFSWELHHGPIPKGLDICHNCPGGDNPSCVNPAHLYPGTPGDNTRDAVRKGQIPTGPSHWLAGGTPTGARGERHGSAKLTEDQVHQILRRLADGESIRALAREAGVSKATIDLIKSGKNWAHLDRTGLTMRQGNGVLTPDQIRAIRAEHAAGGVSRTDLAARYGVGPGCITKIVNRKTWKHIE